METTPTVCACGCGQSIPGRDSRGKIRRFVAGHAGRKEPKGAEPVTCLNCGKAFLKAQWQLRQSPNRHFCCRPCCGEWMSKQGLRRGENNGHYNSVSVPCATCGQSVTKAYSLVFRRNNRVYCQACKLKRNPGGRVSWADYPPEFDKALRRKIRERDGQACQLCGKGRAEAGTLEVHHIDYDKHNNAESNLVALCAPCHGQTNFGQDVWRERLQALMAKRFG